MPNPQISDSWNELWHTQSLMYILITPRAMILRTTDFVETTSDTPMPWNVPLVSLWAIVGKEWQLKIMHNEQFMWFWKSNDK